MAVTIWTPLFPSSRQMSRTHAARDNLIVLHSSCSDARRVSRKADQPFPDVLQTLRSILIAKHFSSGVAEAADTKVLTVARMAPTVAWWVANRERLFSSKRHLEAHTVFGSSEDEDTCNWRL
mmetsp:Transcript_12810/g.35981  ORF Transcript_12810/g.35981 Transcript_12810/m.35981 type:complete len:122 (+) Transcript_12810:3804-4169(+)